MIQFVLNNKVILTAEAKMSPSEVKEKLCTFLSVLEKDFYLLQNGRIVNNSSSLTKQELHIIPRLLGGKGGFGSMLRAIGAQIEKTTNREACRDLSGRRLRDINEEKRLKNWIAQQAERENEAAERKQKKLERLCQKPRHEFKDEDYDKERSELPEKLEDAVTQGFKAAASSQVGQKRKVAQDTKYKKKKRKLWVDADVEDDPTSSDDDISSDDSNSAATSSKSEMCNEKLIHNDSVASLVSADTGMDKHNYVNEKIAE